MKLNEAKEMNVLEDGTFDAVQLMGDHLSLDVDGGDSGLMADEGEAQYMCNLSDIVQKMRVWCTEIPRVQPFYAVKCNDDVTVLRLLQALGAGFDCASKAEIKKVLELGVSSSEIIFANPCKPASHLKYASQNNVSVMTYDSAIELHKIKQHYPDAKVVLRIRCDAKKSQCPLGDKFGCDPKKDGPALLTVARDLNLDVVGISFHVGSGCAEPPVFRKAIAAARELFDYAHTMLGMRLHLLDLGGGYPGDKGTHIREIAAIVNAALDEFFPDPAAVKVIAEPGRFFVASAFTLATTIHSKNEILALDGSVQHVKYYVNDGVYGSFNCQLYDHQHVVPLLLQEELQRRKQRTIGGCGEEPETAPEHEQTGQGLTQNASIWGPTCDALDKICDGLQLPSLAIGDVIYFENMGAYTIPVASPFNGFPLPKVAYFIDQSDWNRVSLFF